MKVYIRLRPSQDDKDNAFDIQPNQDQKGQHLVLKEDINSLQCSKVEKYTYTDIFDKSTQQEDVYNKIMPQIFEDIYNQRKNALVFTYGVTNSGKTYTIMGNDQQIGLLPRSVKNFFKIQSEIFLELSSRKQSLSTDQKNNLTYKKEQNFQNQNQLNIEKVNINNNNVLSKLQLKDHIHITPNCKIQTKKIEYHPVKTHLPLREIVFFISAYQIYRKQILDLLVDKPEKRPELIINQDENKHFYVKDLTRLEAKTEQEALALIQKSAKNRICRGTSFNSESSRSHFNFKIDFVRRFYLDDNKEQMEEIENSLCFVDLAGAERQDKNNIQNKELQQEAIAINEDLLCLQKCIKTISQNKKKNEQNEQPIKPPVRESKLTKMLCQYFNSDTNIVMCANIHPSRKFVSETKLVLQYSSLAFKAEYLNFQYDLPNSQQSNKKNHIPQSTNPHAHHCDNLNPCNNSTSKNVLFNNSQDTDANQEILALKRQLQLEIQLRKNLQNVIIYENPNNQLQDHAQKILTRNYNQCLEQAKQDFQNWAEQNNQIKAQLFEKLKNETMEDQNKNLIQEETEYENNELNSSIIQDSQNQTNNLNFSFNFNIFQNNNTIQSENFQNIFGQQQQQQQNLTTSYENKSQENENQIIVNQQNKKILEEEKINNQNQNINDQSPFDFKNLHEILMQKDQEIYKEQKKSIQNVQKAFQIQEEEQDSQVSIKPAKKGKKTKKGKKKGKKGKKPKKNVLTEQSDSTNNQELETQTDISQSDLESQSNYSEYSSKDSELSETNKNKLNPIIQSDKNKTNFLNLNQISKKKGFLVNDDDNEKENISDNILKPIIKDNKNNNKQKQNKKVVIKQNQQKKNQNNNKKVVSKYPTQDSEKKYNRHKHH